MILPMRSHKTGLSICEYNLIVFSVISETLEEFFNLNLYIVF